MIIGDEAHLFKAVSLTKILTKLVKLSYKIGMTGTLDGTKTHKLVLEGLFGAVNKVVAQRNFRRKENWRIKIFCLVLQHGKMEREFIKNKTYQEEMDFIVSNEKEIDILETWQTIQGNTLCLFQYVEKHGKDLYEAIKDKAKDKQFLSSMAELTQEEKLLENYGKI